MIPEIGLHINPILPDPILNFIPIVVWTIGFFHDYLIHYLLIYFFVIHLRIPYENSLLPLYLLFKFIPSV